MIKLRQRGPALGRFVRTGMIAGAGLLFASTLPFSTAYAAEDDYTDPTTVAPTTPPPANSETLKSLEENLSPSTPAWFRKSYIHMMEMPLLAKIYNQGGIPAFVPQLEIDNNPLGEGGSYQPGGATKTSTNAFFKSLGTNGRACVTCHQPASGMSVSVRNIKKRMNKTGGKDPIFAPVDGANCPNLVPAAETSGGLYKGKKGKGKKAFKEAHSLLINKGLFRIALPVPANAEYDIKVINDPTTCNIDPEYNSVTKDGTTTKIVSVFRRPLMSSNLHFKQLALDFVAGPVSETTGNIMWDGRELNLRTQAIDATLGHAQADHPPTTEEVDQIVAFEMGIFNAQYSDKKAGKLEANGATGGPVRLAVDHGNEPLPAGFPPPPAFDEFASWASLTGTSAKVEKQRSIARGLALFNGTNPRGIFAIDSVAGFNDVIGVNPAPGQTCATCHNFPHSGADFLANSQRDIGIGGHATAINGPNVANDLPVFELTCKNTGQFLWNPALTTVRTNDPGKALISGKCRDIGGITVPGLRALAPREPYFHDGSAATILDVVNVYNTRFSIGWTPAEKADMVNFLNAL